MRERSVALDDWDAIVNAFREIFRDLGEITQDKTGISFTSRPPHVATALTLRRDGRLAASMPLHGLEAKVNCIEWDEGRTRIELVGDAVSYTYRIPPELLAIRAKRT